MKRKVRSESFPALMANFVGKKGKKTASRGSYKSGSACGGSARSALVPPVLFWGKTKGL